MPGQILPSDAAAQGYSSIVGPGAHYAGIDQGIDFTGAFDVLAPADAIVTRALRGGSGWPGQGAVINLRLLNGPAAGRYVYIAEDLVPNVKVGQHVQKGAVIARATGSGQAPGIEYGWALPSGIPLAPRPAPRPAPQYTPQGADFQKFAATDGGGGGFGIGSITGAVGDAAGAVNSAARHVPGVAQAEGIASGAVGVAEFLGKLTDPHFILRGLQVVAGAVLVLVGIVLLTRQVGLAFAQSDTGQAVIKTTEAVATRGASAGKSGAASTAGRRKGNAAISRGEEVTRTGNPERRTMSDRRAARRNAAQRQRAQREATARRDAEYGDIPF